MSCFCQAQRNLGRPQKRKGVRTRNRCHPDHGHLNGLRWHRSPPPHVLAHFQASGWACMTAVSLNSLLCNRFDAALAQPDPRTGKPMLCHSAAAKHCRPANSGEANHCKVASHPQGYGSLEQRWSCHAIESEAAQNNREANRYHREKICYLT